jgi:hypothetical protein
MRPADRRWRRSAVHSVCSPGGGWISYDEFGTDIFGEKLERGAYEDVEKNSSGWICIVKA